MRRLTTATLIGATLLAANALAQRPAAPAQQRDEAPDTNAIIIEPTHPGWGNPTYPSYPVHPSYPTYPTYPTHPPVYQDPGHDGGRGDRVVIRHFDNSGRIREDRRSTFFRTDSRRTVESIEVRWTDNREEAKGRLLIETGRGTTALEEFDVNTPGRVSWRVGTRITGFQIEARRDDIWLEEIVIHFGGGYSQPPSRPGHPGPANPVLTTPTRIFGGRGHDGLRVREDTISGVFQVPGSGVHVGRIRVVWTDDGEEAEGRLILRGRGGRSFPARDVSSPGEVVWEVNGPVNGVQIAAEDDDLWIREIWLEP